MRHAVNCFVLMPIGVRADPASDVRIDFDHIYRAALAPAIEAVGLRPIRDDDRGVGGVVQKQVFEALLWSDYVVADLTTANPNVLYELGIRHTARPRSTLALTANPGALPFDVRDLRCIRYRLDRASRLPPSGAAELRAALAGELRHLRHGVAQGGAQVDSPVFQLVPKWGSSRAADGRGADDDLYERVRERFAALRVAGLAATADLPGVQRSARRLQARLGDLEGVDPRVLDEVLLTFRALEDWDALITLEASLPRAVRTREAVRAHLAFALVQRARRGDDGDRERALRAIGHNDAGDGDLGAGAEIRAQVHADRWTACLCDDPARAAAHARAAANAYAEAFVADPCDPWPGACGAVLARVCRCEDRADWRVRLEPAVEFAAERLLNRGQPGFRPFASLAIMAAMRGDAAGAQQRAGETRAWITERWQGPALAEQLLRVADWRREDGAGCSSASRPHRPEGTRRQ